MKATGEATERTTTRPLHPVFLFSIFFSVIFLLHAPLLRLPYFWDEAGYYIPAARDLLLTGSPIPHSTLSNAHPPLALAWLALWWKLSGYTAAVTRTAVLLVAALALTAVYRLARAVANPEVAAAATACTALYPVFFVQSSLAHVDMAAAALVLWGLVFYVERRWAAAGIVFSLAVLAKETAVIAPLALGVWNLGCRIARQGSEDSVFAPPPLGATTALLLAPAGVLATWYGYHYHATGYVFGNPQFFRYNVTATLSPVRITLTLLKRVWQLIGYMNLFLLTAAAAAAMRLRPQPDVAERERPRIAPPHQAVFGVVILAYVAVLSLVGGAVLARYMLPALPLVIILCVSTLWRRVQHWPVAVAIVCLGFVLALFINPPYSFPPEDNLAYRDYVLLHKRAADLVAQRYGSARVLTAWPATDELSYPYLGYSRVAVPVVPIDDFSAPQLALAARDNSLYDVALLFSTKYQPARDLLLAIPGWERLQARFFGFHRDLPPAIAARMLDGRLVFQTARRGQWVAVVEIERVQNAQALPTGSGAVPSGKNYPQNELDGSTRF